MNLKMRPMSEAPKDGSVILLDLLGKSKAVREDDQDRFHLRYFDAGEKAWCTTDGAIESDPFQSAQGFYLVSDLLRAAEILAAITPEGYEFTGEFRIPAVGEPFYDGSGEPDSYIKDLDDELDRRAILRRIKPPVEYEYVTDGKAREPLPDDYIYSVGEWRQYKFLEEQFHEIYDGPQLCYRRVEVKR